MAMARDFNFPNKIIYSMHKLRGMRMQGTVGHRRHGQAL